MKFKWDFSEFYEFAEQLESVDLDNVFKRIAQAISKELWKRMKMFTPIGETGDLIKGWNNNNFAVTTTEKGYLVEIINTTPYAIWVNDGHRSFNKWNVGTNKPYVVENRVKVPYQYKWQKGDGTHYVFGHFFVERGILSLVNSTQLDTIIFNELMKWWNSL